MRKDHICRIADPGSAVARPPVVIALVAMLIGAFLLLPGCARVEMSEEESREFEKVIAAVLAHDKAYIRAHAHPEILKDSFDSNVDRMFQELPSGTHVDTQLGSYRWTKFWKSDTEYTDAFTLYQFQFTDGWTAAQFQLRFQGDTVKIMGLRLQRLPADLRIIHAFRLSGKPLWQLAFLASVVAVPIFIVCTLVVAFRMRRSLRYRYIWFVFIALGIGRITMLWTTGAISVNPLSVGLLGAAFSQSGDMTPWLLTLYLPIGAAAFWLSPFRYRASSPE